MASTDFSILNNMIDPLLDFKWVCTSLPAMGVGTLPTNYVEEFDLPFPTISVKEGLFGGGTYTYYPGYEDISAFDITFYEDREMSTTKYIESWRRNIRNPDTGGYYLPTQYKKDLLFEMLDQQGDTIARLKMVSVWPTGQGNWTLNQAGNRIQVHVNFSVDGGEIEFL